MRTTKQNNKENEFKEIEVLREVEIKQNPKSGKLDLNLKLNAYDLDDLLLQKGKLKKVIIGKINIEVLEK